MADTVRVHGLRELDRALRKVNKDAAKRVRDALKDAAEPVVATARARLARFEGAKPGSVRAHALAKGVVVRQGARKVSGLRPDFGSLQMVEVLIPARALHADDVEERVEDALERLGREHGF